MTEYTQIQAINKVYHNLQADIYSIIIKYMRQDRVPMLKLIIDHPMKLYTPFLLKNCGLRGQLWTDAYAQISDKIQAIYELRKSLIQLYLQKNMYCSTHTIVLQDFKNICNIDTSIICTPEDIVYGYRY